MDTHGMGTPMIGYAAWQARSPAQRQPIVNVTWLRTTRLAVRTTSQARSTTAATRSTSAKTPIARLTRWSRFARQSVPGAAYSVLSGRW